jgi:hypothetical protein
VETFDGAMLHAERRAEVDTAGMEADDLVPIKP